MREKIHSYFSDIFKTKSKKITLIAYIVTPIVCNILIEMFNARSFFKGLTYPFRDTYSFIINVFIILFTLSIGLLLRKRLAYIFTVGTLWVVLGVVNFVITSKRVTPFSASDIKLLNSIEDTIKKYLNAFELILIIIGIAIGVVLIAMIWMKLPRYAEKLNYLRNIVLIGASFVMMMVVIEVGFAINSLSPKFPNMTIAYADYGFPYCFAISFVNRGVDEPDKYSENAVKDILEEMESAKTVDSEDVKTPNIIFLQLESFFDVEKMKDLELSKEATPIFNSLKEKYPSGYLTVNNVGYGTANTEFEVMTGLNLDDFGPGEFPYTTILTKTTCETMGYILKDYDYITHAIHNNRASFYSRRTVFTRLGFDTFTSIEYMYPEEYTKNDWAKDKILTDEIMKALKSTEEKDYIYTISVQGHGDYPTTQVLEEPEITVVGGIDDESRKYEFEYYVNMINEMDTFVGDLIEQLSEFDEDVVLVIYGDHLPSLDIEEEELENGDLYQTEYIVWNNINLQMEDKDIETYQLSSRILKHLNIDEGVINKLHQTFEDDEDYTDKLHLMTYDILYGNMFGYDGINPYVVTDMKMGTFDICITDVEKAKQEDVEEYISISEDNINLEQEEATSGAEDEVESSTNPLTSFLDKSNDDDETEDTRTDNTSNQDASGWYIVKGEHFTEFSTVYINDEEYETIYVNENKLIINAPDLTSLDVLVVKQKNNTTILSETKSFTYFDVEDVQDSDTLESKE